MTTATEPLARIAFDLEAHGWARKDEFIDAELVRALRLEAGQLLQSGEFRPAAVGAGAQRAVRLEVRSDEICWLRQSASAATERVRRAFEELRLALNRDLQLGLFEHELHLARYAPGAFYGRHVDRLPGAGVRVVSTVLYLNDAWRTEEGGALRLHLAEGEGANASIDILPQAGRLVAFFSDGFEHEVLPARRERLSLTGWFRRRA